MSIVIVKVSNYDRSHCVPNLSDIISVEKFADSSNLLELNKQLALFPLIIFPQNYNIALRKKWVVRNILKKYKREEIKLPLLSSSDISAMCNSGSTVVYKWCHPVDTKGDIWVLLYDMENQLNISLRAFIRDKIIKEII